MKVQDINAYIEELEYIGDTENLDSTKIHKKKVISEFISLLHEQLETEEADNKQDRRMSIHNWVKIVDESVKIIL